jgi:uncharacterized phage infection (PIP) family protein YhgE
MSNPTEKKKGNSNPPAAPGEETAESLDRVRDILFGAQMRTVDRRLAQIEERLLREFATARAELEKQVAALDAAAKRSLAGLDEKLKAEQAKRGEEDKALRGELKDGVKNLDRGLAQLQAASNQEDAELRGQLLELGKQQGADLRRVADQLSTDLKQAVLELRTEKTDTASLVELLTEMAQRLSSDLAGPDSGKG